jgi:hypothetical protein
MKRGTTLAVAIVLGLAGAAYLARGAIGIARMRRVAANSIFSDTIATLPDGLQVAFCGTGSPFPSPTRSGPCTAIIAGPRLDLGRGTPAPVRTTLPLLEDQGHRVIDRYGIFNPQSRGWPHPATYVIDKTGMVRWRFVETDYHVRPTKDDILAALKSLD